MSLSRVKINGVSILVINNEYVVAAHIYCAFFIEKYKSSFAFYNSLKFDMVHIDRETYEAVRGKMKISPNSNLMTLSQARRLCGEEEDRGTPPRKRCRESGVLVEIDTGMGLVPASRIDDETYVQPDGTVHDNAPIVYPARGTAGKSYNRGDSVEVLNRIYGWIPAWVMDIKPNDRYVVCAMKLSEEGNALVKEVGKFRLRDLTKGRKIWDH